MVYNIVLSGKILALLGNRGKSKSLVRQAFKNCEQKGLKHEHGRAAHPLLNKTRLNPNTPSKQICTDNWMT